MKWKVSRTDILNYLIKKYKLNSYLEIGVRNPNSGNFNKIIIKDKLGIDPEPIVKQDNIYVGTSDEFFKQNNKKFDIIFIDGLHLTEQVDKDIVNSLKCLNNGGFILLHDCNPPTEFHQRVEYCVNGEYPSWNGTVWKSIAKLRMCFKNISISVIDTDWGIGLIHSGTNNLYPKSEINYKLLEENRKELLNLISTDEFYNKY